MFTAGRWPRQLNPDSVLCDGRSGNISSTCTRRTPGTDYEALNRADPRQTIEELASDNTISTHSMHSALTIAGSSIPVDVTFDETIDCCSSHVVANRGCGEHSRASARAKSAVYLRLCSSLFFCLGYGHSTGLIQCLL